MTSDLETVLTSLEAEHRALVRSSAARPWDIAPAVYNRLRCAEEELRLVRIVLGRTATPTLAAPRSKNPFVGLAAYEEADGASYFGRDGAARDVLDLVLRRELAVLLGRSGAGKSSLVRCRLLPLLRSMGHAALSLRFDPSLPTEPAVGRVLDRARHIRGAPVVVVDQFEEAYTRGTGADREAMRGMLDAMLARGVHVLLSLREDYAAELVDMYGSLLAPSTTYRLRSFSSFTEVKEILISTFALGGIDLDPPAAGFIAARLLGSGECYPPHLQIYGAYAFEEAKPSARAALAFAEGLLPVERVVHERLTRILETMPEPAQENTKRISSALVTPSGARRRATLEEILEQTGLEEPEAIASIRHLEEIHFVVGSNESGYELTHDYVARSITERFFSERDRSLLLAGEVLRHAYQDWLRFGVRLGPSRLRTITACAPSDLRLSGRMAAFLYVAILAELRAFRPPAPRHLSWDELMTDLKAMASRAFELHDLEQLDALIQTQFPWVRMIRKNELQRARGDIGLFVVHGSGTFEADLRTEFGAGDDEVDAATFVHSLPALREADAWSLIAEASPAAWPDLAYVLNLRATRFVNRKKSTMPNDLFPAFDRVIGSWGQSPDAAMALIGPMLQALTRWPFDDRKRAVLGRVITKIRNHAPKPDPDAAGWIEREPVSDDSDAAHIVEWALEGSQGAMLADVLRACEGSSRRFKDIARLGIFCAIHACSSLPEIAPAFAGTSDHELRLLIVFLASTAYRRQPSAALAELLLVALADPSPVVVEHALGAIEAAGLPLDPASTKRLLEGGGVASRAGRALLLDALPATWSGLEALGVERIWSTLVTHDAAELVPNLMPFLSELGAWAKAVGRDPVVAAARSESPSIRLLAVAVLDAASPIAGVDWLQIALGPRCTVAAEGREPILRAAVGLPSSGLASIVQSHVSPYLEAAAARFAWRSLEARERRWLAHIVEQRHVKLEEEGTFVEVALLMPPID